MTAEIPEKIVRVAPRSFNRRLAARLAILIMFLITAALAVVHWDRAVEGRNDFLQLYIGATLVGTSDLYSPAAYQRRETEIIGGWMKGVYYSRVPLYAFVLKPLAKLPYRTAYLIYEALGLIAFAVFAYRFLSRCGVTLLLAGFFFPLMVNFLAGQDLAFVMLAAMGSLMLAKSGRLDFLAGLLLTPCAIKYHFFILVPLLLFTQKRWRIFAGAAVGVGGVVVLSFGVAGAAWPKEYLVMLQEPELHHCPEYMPNLFGVLRSVGAPASVMLSAAVAVAGVVWKALVRATDYETGFGLTLLGGLLLSYHSYVQDCSLLLLAIPLVLRLPPRRPADFALLALLAPILYLSLLRGVPYNAIIPALLALALLSAAFSRIVQGTAREYAP